MISAPITTDPPRARLWYRRAPWLVLGVLLVLAVFLSMRTGAVHVGARQAFHVVWDHAIWRLQEFAIGDLVADLWSGFASLPVIGSLVGVLDDLTEPVRSWLTPAYTAREETVIWQIRAPRVFLGAAVGGLIAVASALIQTSLRNPLADPGLIGISAGGAWAAYLVSFVPAWTLVDGVPGSGNLDVLQPVAASLACLGITLLLWLLASRWDSIDAISFLLAGIAINALMIAGIGLTSAFEGDVLQGATSFWGSGGLTQALWYPVKVTVAVLFIAWVVTPFLGRSLNILALGDRDARHIGVDVFRVRLVSIVIAAILLGFAVSYAGAIAFVGLIVPQALRLWLGGDARRLLVCSPLAGALTVVIADLLARTVADPIEVGLGLILTVIGAPLFIVMMLQLRHRQAVVA